MSTPELDNRSVPCGREACRLMMADSSEEVVRLTRSTEVLFETLKSLYESVEAVRRLQSDELAASKSSQRTDTGEHVLDDNGTSTTVASLNSQLDQVKVEAEEKDYWVWKAGEFSKELTSLKTEHRVVSEDRVQLRDSVESTEARLQNQARAAEGETWLLEQAVAWYKDPSHRRRDEAGAEGSSERARSIDMEGGPPTWADELYWNIMLYIQASFMDVLGGDRADYDDYILSFEDEDEDEDEEYQEEEYQERRVGVGSTQWVKSRNPKCPRLGGNINW